MRTKSKSTADFKLNQNSVGSFWLFFSLTGNMDWSKPETWMRTQWEDFISSGWQFQLEPKRKVKLLGSPGLHSIWPAFDIQAIKPRVSELPFEQWLSSRSCFFPQKMKVLLSKWRQKLKICKNSRSFSITPTQKTWHLVFSSNQSTRPSCPPTTS